MTDVKTYKFFGLEHLLVNPNSDSFVMTLVNEDGLEETFFVNPWTLPSYIPELLDEMYVSHITNSFDDLYPTVDFVQDDPKGFEEQAIVIQIWQRYREKLRGKAVVGSSVITDGAFDGN